MNRSKVILIGSLAVIAAAWVILWVEHRSLARTLEETDQSHRMQASAASEAAQLRRATEKQAQATTARAIVASSHRPNPDSTVDTGQVARTRAAVAGWARIYFGPLGRQLGLTPEQSHALEQVAMEGQFRSHDLDDAIQAQGISPDSPEAKQLIQTQAQATQNEEIQIVGQANASALADYNRKAPMRTWILGLAGNIYANEPLTQAQADSAVQILADSSASYQSGGNAGLDDLDWTRAQSQLSSTLSAGQLSLLTTMIQGQMGAKDVMRRLGPSQPASTPTKN
jgi:hypothetical protein